MMKMGKYTMRQENVRIYPKYYSNWDFIKTVWIRNKELQDKIILENIKKKLLNEGTRY